MRDLVSASFGLLIAFVLPGLTTLYGIRSWLPGLEEFVERSKGGEAGTAALVFVALMSVVLGLVVAVVRGFLLERMLFSNHRLDDRAFVYLPGRTDAYQQMIDHHYRYHQFWGGMFVAVPILTVGNIGGFDWWTTAGALAVAGLLEWFLLWGAKDSWIRYVTRATFLLEGAPEPEEPPGRPEEARWSEAAPADYEDDLGEADLGEADLVDPDRASAGD